jgi:copper homeostasis protein
MNEGARVQVEICVGDVESAIAAEIGGADRVELCDNLAVGGTTPSAGAIEEATTRLKIPVHVLIRPRGGDFCYSECERSVMRRDIELVKRIGAAGVVIGVLNRDSTIDCPLMAELFERARPLSITFHKAIDQTPDLEESLETLIDLGVDRILTSGGRPTALEGLETLTRLVDRAAGRIAIMAGGRLTLETLPTIIQKAGVREVHLGSAVNRIMPDVLPAQPFDGSDKTWNQADAARVATVVSLVRRLALS